MKNILIALLGVFLPISGLFAQGYAQDVDLDVHCLGVELDGSQTLRVSGYGKNKSDAKEQAKKNAVWAVVFCGIREGADGCNTVPLVTEVNARERYEDYFNAFFSDKGAYKEYVSNEDYKKGSKSYVKSKLGAKYTVTVRVLRPQLKTRLKADGIIK